MAKKVASLNGKRITASELKKFKAKQASEDKKFWQAKIKTAKTELAAQKKKLAERKKLPKGTVRNIRVAATTKMIKELEAQIKRLQKI